MRDLGECEVHDWLRGPYAEYPVKVQEIRIPSVRRPNGRSRKKLEIFNAAFFGRDSAQHGWLKWFAINFLGLPANYEVEIFIPAELGRYGNRAGRVLPRGHSYRSAPGCRFQRADVCSLDTLVEVGVTSPQSLIEPLWSYSVRSAIWLPFQFADLHADWVDFAHENRAFMIHRAQRIRSHP